MKRPPEPRSVQRLIDFDLAADKAVSDIDPPGIDWMWYNITSMLCGNQHTSASLLIAGT